MIDQKDINESIFQTTKICVYTQIDLLSSANFVCSTKKKFRFIFWNVIYCTSLETKPESLASDIFRRKIFHGFSYETGCSCQSFEFPEMTSKDRL